MPMRTQRAGIVLVLALLVPVCAFGAPGTARAAEPDLAPFVRFAPRPNVEAVRCIASPVTRTETIFWGATNRADAPVAGAFTIELARIHPDGTQTLLKRETAERLGAGESLVLQYMYPVMLCVTTDPRLPWPGGGRFRVMVDVGGLKRSADALDP